jgi:large subunit ribosomal protein L17
LVDFNELYNPNAEEKKTTRRSRRSTAAPKKAEVADAPAVEEAKADTTEEKTEE